VKDKSWEDLKANMKLGCLPSAVNFRSDDSDDIVLNFPPLAAAIKFKFFHKVCRLNADFEFNVDSTAKKAADDDVERSGS
jgi:hypothetical protein